MGTVLPFRRKTVPEAVANFEDKLAAAEDSLDTFFEKIISDNISKNQQQRLDRVKRNRQVLKQYRMDSRKDRGK